MRTSVALLHQPNTKLNLLLHFTAAYITHEKSVSRARIAILACVCESNEGVSLGAKPIEVGVAHLSAASCFPRAEDALCRTL
jgi:hypothetical protein